MNILLLGELSGVHEELAPALRRMGHQVTVGHSRLASTNFPSDIPLFRPPSGQNDRITEFRDIGSQLWNAPRLTGFDVVQVITPKFFHWKLHGVMMRYLKRHNKALVVISTSCSSDYHRRVKDLAYRPCKECMAFDLKSDRCIYDRPDEVRAERLSYELADAIVATHFEYAFALADTPFAVKVVGIPLPVNTALHRPSPMPESDRIRIWYGETRYGFKGSAFILPALERLKASPLRERIDIVSSGRLARNDYFAFLDGVHIVIDQASSYGMGMNALYALARGRIVLSGAEREALDFMGVQPTENPLINIRPDVDHIVKALEQLAVLNASELAEWGQRSAAYVERFHSADVVARRYSNLYAQLLPGRRYQECA